MFDGARKLRGAGETVSIAGWLLAILGTVVSCLLACNKPPRRRVGYRKSRLDRGWVVSLRAWMDRWAASREPRDFQWSWIRGGWLAGDGPSFQEEIKRSGRPRRMRRDMPGEMPRGRTGHPFPNLLFTLAS